MDSFGRQRPTESLTMPIHFACDCGKQFRVAEEHAGKRSKCPACGITLSVPAAPEPHADEAAYRALSDGPEPEPVSRDWREPGLTPPATIPAPRPTPAPNDPAPRAPKKKTKKAASGDPFAPRDRQWTIDWGRVIGGLLGTLLGCGVLVGGLAMNRFFIWSPIIILGGLFGVINGLLHKE